jgi:hypothetical protein
LPSPCVAPVTTTAGATGSPFLLMSFMADSDC